MEGYCFFSADVAAIFYADVAIFLCGRCRDFFADFLFAGRHVRNFALQATSLFSWTEAGHRPAPSSLRDSNVPPGDSLTLLQAFTCRCD